MARLWPAGGGAPPEVEISSSRFVELEKCLGIAFDDKQRITLVELCNQYLDWEDLQDAAQGSPAVAKRWLKLVRDSGVRLKKALETGQDHSKRVAACHLRADMLMNFEVVRRGLHDLTWAAERVLEQRKLHITNDTRGPDENDALRSFARGLAKLVHEAGGYPTCAGGDGRAPVSPFVRFVHLLFGTFPTRDRRLNSDRALAKRLERILDTGGQER